MNQRYTCDATALLLVMLSGCADAAPEDAVTNDPETPELEAKSDALTIADLSTPNVAFDLSDYRTPYDQQRPRFKLRSRKLISSNISAWPSDLTSGELPGDPAGDIVQLGGTYRSAPYHSTSARTGSDIAILTYCGPTDVYCTIAASLMAWSGEIPESHRSDTLIYDLAGTNQNQHDVVDVIFGTDHFERRVELRFFPGGAVYAENDAGAAVSLGTIPAPYRYSVHVEVNPTSGSTKISTSFGPTRTLLGGESFRAAAATISLHVEETSTNATFLKVHSFSANTFGVVSY